VSTSSKTIFKSRSVNLRELERSRSTFCSLGAHTLSGPRYRRSTLTVVVEQNETAMAYAFHLSVAPIAHSANSGAWRFSDVDILSRISPWGKDSLVTSGTLES